MLYTKNELNDMIKWGGDIGMFQIDRPINNIPLADGTFIQGSCNRFKTKYCAETCYNLKLYRMYPNMKERDIRCERNWQKMGKHNTWQIAEHLSKKRKQTKRARFMSRGEACANKQDVFRIKALAEDTPDTNWWLPTRAWRNGYMRMLIEDELMTMPNVSVNASFDPSNDEHDWEVMQIRHGWNIMFYGDDSPDAIPFSKSFECPKTWKKMKGHCSICKGGCFSSTVINRQSIVHLSEH